MEDDVQPALAWLFGKFSKSDEEVRPEPEETDESLNEWGTSW